jgi:threonine aldolase
VETPLLIPPERDLRSDAVTLPTPDMWEAMQGATLGWAPRGEDPSVRRLEQEAARLVGKDDATFVPTGSMANLVALMTHGRPGDQVVAEESSHILWSEREGFARICGMVARPVAGRPACPRPDELDAVLREERFGHRRRTTLICVENTHNYAGGVAITPTEMSAVAEVAKAHDVPIHLDGARLFNASVALGVAPHELVRGADSVMFNLNKGLSAPCGALLCGSAAFVESARVNLERLGGHSLPQAGIWAAAGLVGLRARIPHLAEDHETALRLAHELAAVPGLRVDPSQVRTNILNVGLEPPLRASDFVQGIRATGVGAYLRSHDSVRLVTHRHIGRDAVPSLVGAACRASTEARLDTSVRRR